MRKIIVLFFVLLSVCGCHRPRRLVTASFYYWRSIFSLDKTELNTLDSLHCRKLYVKFFDVDRDRATGQLMPMAPVRFADSGYHRFVVIPVVYMTNVSLLATKDGAIGPLADSIGRLVNAICKAAAISYSELQIDCDWTVSSRNKYFALLKRLRAAMPASAILSCTIRLHQIKYAEKTGVPPVDRGMLMYYNMGHAEDINERNSIYDPANADKYVSFVKDYPLRLDVALPVFSWGVLFRTGRPKQLLDGFSKKDLDGDPHFRLTKDNWYEVDSSFFIHGYYLKAHDLIRLEEISPYLCRQAAAQLGPKLKDQDIRIVFFDLQDKNLERYDTRNFKEILDLFH